MSEGFFPGGQQWIVQAAARKIFPGAQKW